MMRVAFRVDSGILIGSGHVQRTLTLANELRRCGAKVVFISRTHEGHLLSYFEREEHVVYPLPVPATNKNEPLLGGYEAWLGVTPEQDAIDTVAVLEGQFYDWLVVDHYALDYRWEEALRVIVDKIMVIDDLANRTHDCDLLLDQNYFGIEAECRYENKLPLFTQLLLGPKFSLLQPDYAQLHDICLPKDERVKRVLIYFGGVDLENQTSKVLSALTTPELSHLLVDVVVGSNCLNLRALEEQVARRGNVTFYQSLPTLADLMMQSDLVIGAGGSTTWERMCLGKASVITCVAENQRIFSQKLSHDGYQVVLSTDESDTYQGWQQKILELINSPFKRKAMSKKAYQLVDGLGCRRVVDKMFEINSSDTKKLNINILSDEDSWFAGMGEKLSQSWVQDGHEVLRISRPEKLIEGDVCFILSCSKILTEKQLALNSHNIVVHASALPEGRGWSPMTWQILEGKNKICVTLFEAMSELDAGPIYAQNWLILDGLELVDEWRKKLEAVIQRLCIDWVSGYPESTINAVPQCGEGSYYPRRKAGDSELDLDKTLREQFNHLRVVDNNSYPAFFYLNGQKYCLYIEKMS
ncbi:MAG: UDP-2,4-diacetamido-2,4,6-trideoxy-beta-L-altropyranose hydrolase [Legionellaceae bacterium]|nr:UDP-2,4-diacetamido-2,4,6-trideoxy-beta-L-altropyranose hydrolase [Legionellaceae bacterium]